MLLLNCFEITMKEPQLRFPEFTASWSRIPLKNICTRKASNLFEYKLRNCPGEYKLYGAAGVVNNINFFTENERYIAIVNVGSVGKVLLCDQNSSVTSTLDVIKINQNFNIDFMYCIFSYKFNFQRYFAGTSLLNLYFDSYGNELITFPEFKEQEKIADFINSINEKINLLEQETKLLKKYKDGIIQRIFC